MSSRIFITAAYICNLLLGNMCLLQSVQAAETGEERALMSQEDAINCPWINQSSGPVHLPEQESPCASGHCYKAAEPLTAIQAIVAAELHAAALPLSATAEDIRVPAADPEMPACTESPPLPVDIETIVMLL